MPISTIDQKGLTNPLTSVAANTVTSAAATALTLQSAGTTAITVDTSQNVGIGTSSPDYNLQVEGSGDRAIAITSTTNGDCRLWLGDTAAPFNGAVIYRNDSDSLAFNTVATERMRIDSSGNVGIGTSSPSTKLHVDGTGNQYTRVSSSTHSNFIQAGCVSGSTFHEYKSVYRLVDTDAGERMRIDSSGNVIMGNTSYDYSVNGFGFGAGNAYSYFTRTSGFALLINRKTTTGAMQVFNYNNSGVGDISTNGSNCTFNSTSDYRLKQNIQPMTGALARVNLLKPVTYNWIRENQAGEGFIAHELQEVVPEAVTGTKDAVDEDGNPVYQAIDQSVLVATLTAAIQELKAEFDAYKASHP